MLTDSRTKIYNYISGTYNLAIVGGTALGTLLLSNHVWILNALSIVCYAVTMLVAVCIPSHCGRETKVAEDVVPFLLPLDEPELPSSSIKLPDPSRSTHSQVNTFYNAPESDVSKSPLADPLPYPPRHMVRLVSLPPDPRQSPQPNPHGYISVSRLLSCIQHSSSLASIYLSSPRLAICYRQWRPRFESPRFLVSSIRTPIISNLLLRTHNEYCSNRPSNLARITTRKCGRDGRTRILQVYRNVYNITLHFHS